MLAAERYDSSEPVNIGSGEEIAIRDLAHDRSREADRLRGHASSGTRAKPNGQPRRRLDVTARARAVRLRGHARRSTDGLRGDRRLVRRTSEGDRETMKRALDHRHHRPGRLVPGRAAAREGLRGPRRHPPLELVQHRAPRPHLPGPARRRTTGCAWSTAISTTPARSNRVAAAACSPTRSTTSARRATCASASTCPSTRRRRSRMGTLRLLEAIRELGLDKTCRFYQASSSEMFGAARAAAERDHAVPAAQPVRVRQGVRPPAVPELPRGVRDVHLVRHPVQPRVPAPRRSRSSRARSRAPRRASSTASTRSCSSATSTPSATGASPATTSRRCG